MKHFTRTIILLFTLFNAVNHATAQNWQLVWQDEFTNGIGPDWVFETGNGSGGWGNNELQYYRSQNASVVNGQLVITARNESFGGYNYTSVRMKTQGRRSWKYGKIEARIAMPAFQGIWPAFWMLGDNIGSVGWPACGEIDIMEHVNAENRTYGTAHWSDNNNNYASYGGNTAVGVTGFHVYTIEWNATTIKWLVDGVQFHIINIANGVNGTGEFQNNFFIILNMAVGGNWPGFTVNNAAFPANMYVDYVRVYQDGGGTTYPSTTIQAENYSSMAGVQTEATTDAGGGSNVGYIEAGDWMAYNSINFPISGTYKVEYRVASLSGGGRLSLDLNAGTTVLGALDVPSTGGWQNWTTISHNVTVNAGTYNLGIFAVTGGWNINWIRITPLSAARTIAQVGIGNKDATGSATAKVITGVTTVAPPGNIAFTIYPNPVQQQLAILTSEDISGATVRITDIAGRIVLATSLSTNHIDVSRLVPGMYTLVYTKKDTVITRQFIK